ncbi:hypothetical protein MMAD_18520 [Mycolicibacterium madagascariense]|uniref:Uncharacterized protein n=1 Tax=Mycolicibacterium madagascariense TaxID=212765 RepID=A0A7I7XED8_9MYCO|nr:hypothetical protein MMAD_18520 [Mycolicibacterium madagascariense]
MCQSFPCHHVAQWVSANPAALYVGVLFAALTLFRLARRGRWIVVFAVLIVWAIAGGIVLLLG